MDIQVDITEEFDKSYKKIPQPKRKLIGDKINQLVDNLRNGNKRSLMRPRGIEFPANIKKSQSTLYIFRATPEYRAVVSLDDDPMFNQKVLTLYDITRHDSITVCFMAVATKLYK